MRVWFTVCAYMFGETLLLRILITCQTFNQRVQQQYFFSHLSRQSYGLCGRQEGT
jgi:hypothetical protein